MYPFCDGPEDLFSNIAANWEFIAGTASREDVRRIIHTLYRLGLASNERRYPRFLITLPDLPSIATGRNPSFVQLGDSSDRLYLGDIAHLAPAIAPPPYALVLGYKDVIKCLGLLEIPTRDDRWIPDGWFFGVRGPGNLEVTLKRGVKRDSWILTHGTCRPHEDLARNELLKRVAGKNDVRSVVRQLAYSIAKREHGGALLFASESKLRDIGISATVSFRESPLPLLGDSKNQIPHSSRTEAISRLSQIDGALLFDLDFNLHGAGVFVNFQPGESFKVYVEGYVEGQKHVAPIEVANLGLGSRHRSAAAFCLQNTGAVALVVSMDGAIRVFANVNDRVDLFGPYIDPMVP